MTIIRENNTVHNPLYEDIIKISYGGQFGETNYLFKQNGVFLSKEEASNIWKALTKRPIECDSEEELFAVQAAVGNLKRVLASIDSETVKADVHDGWCR